MKLKCKSFLIETTTVKITAQTLPIRLYAIVSAVSIFDSRFTNHKCLQNGFKK